ncbi:O-methyltransferase [Streptomyces leeuwenhoekii]|uniref:O-methyltransferase yrrM n=1 Tax=Streptomyces leeuwenhoekii TaxID=1437453 RepID=A0A0F7W282_STRLW|nr:O-methyltransferase [Streptomyces leeuwenhoekii]CQR66120.1 Putative O-methyltransferase yrrM [Streptomyces leeuwenhoekii]
MTRTPQGYLRAVLGPRDPVLDDILRRSLLDDRFPTIQVDDNAGRILQLLTRLRRPGHVLEIGTLFGYSTIHLARGLPEGGRVTTLEIDPRAAEVARRNLRTAGVDDRVDVVVGDAFAYLASVPQESVGLVFIDADKKSYPDYLKLCYPLLEPGGLLIADDAFAQGDFTAERVEGSDEDREVKAIHQYNRAVGRSTRLFSAFVGTESGLLVSVKE